MTRLITCVAVILLTVSLPQARAADPPAGTPANTILGYIFDSAGRTIHPVLGTTGAAQLGDALPSIPLSTFVAAPGKNYGLAVDAPAKAAYFVELTPAAASASPISALNDGADRIVVSPAGSAAAFYNRQSRSVQIVRGLPEARSVTSPIALDSLPGLITAMAVNDAGDSLLVGIAAESGGSLHLVGPSRDPRHLIAAGRIVSIAFLPGASDAVIADHDRNEVTLIRNVAESPAATLLGGEPAGIIQPASVAASRDGLSVYVINGRRRRVTRLAVAGGAPSSIDCACKPDRLMPLAGNAVFGLTAASGSPLYIYDGDRETNGRLDPRIVAVPVTSPAKLTPPKPSRPLPQRRGRSAR